MTELGFMKYLVSNKVLCPCRKIKFLLRFRGMFQNVLEVSIVKIFAKHFYNFSILTYKTMNSDAIS